MRYHHEKVAHAGKIITINELRSQTYWIIKSTSTFKSSPFTYWGIDTFGAFLVKDGKYYNEMFPCISSRTVYNKATKNLSIDSFILALRRLIIQ